MNTLRALAVALAAAGALGGCGDDGAGGSGPLGDVLTDDQQTQLAKAFVATYAPPEGTRDALPEPGFSKQHLAAISATCNDLDGSVPLLATYAASCRLGVELIDPPASTVQTGPCLMDFAPRCRAAHEETVDLDRRTAAAMAAVAREARAIEDRACHDQVAGTDDQRRAIQELPATAERMLAAHVAREREAFDDAAGDYSDVLTRVSGGPDYDPPKLVRAYRDACEPPADAGLDELLRRLQ